MNPPPSPFGKVREMTAGELRRLGCGTWDEPDADGRTLMLFPHGWFRRIPPGFLIETINGEIKPFAPRVTSSDQRFGCLAFGVRVPIA